MPLLCYSNISVQAYPETLYAAWMGLGAVLNWINTKVLLVLIFFLLFTPCGIVLRILKVDLLDRRIEKNKNSYWIPAERSPGVQGYERQF